MQQFPFNTSEQLWQEAFRQLSEVSPPPDFWARIEAELPDATELCLAAAIHEAAVSPPPSTWESIESILNQALPLINFEQMFAQTNLQVITPPANIWENIENKLNENEENIADFEQLTAYEVAPQTSIWDNIAAKLNEGESNIQSFEQLTAYEVAPQTNIWDNIAARLNENESETTDFAAAFLPLAAFEAAPNDTNWESIAARLEETAANDSEEAEEVDDFSAFRALADYEAAPPAFNWEQVVAPVSEFAENINNDDHNLLDIAAAFAPLADLEITPHSSIWEQIEAKLEEDDEEIGAFGRLRGLDKMPSSEIWQRISQDLPFHPLLRQYLVNFSRVAAVLLLALGTATLYNNWAEITGNSGDYAQTETPNSSNLANENGKNSSKGLAANTPKTAQKNGDNQTNGSGNNNSPPNLNAPPGSESTHDKKADTYKIATRPSLNNGKNSGSKFDNNSNNGLQNGSQNNAQGLAANDLRSVNTSKSPKASKNVKFANPIFSNPTNTPFFDNGKNTNANNGQFQNNNTEVANATPRKNFENTPDKVEGLAVRNLNIAEKPLIFSIPNLPKRRSFKEEMDSLRVFDAFKGDKYEDIGGVIENKLEHIQKQEALAKNRNFVGLMVQGTGYANMPFTFQKAILKELSPQDFEATYAAKFGGGVGLAVGYQFNPRFSLLLGYNRMWQGGGFSRVNSRVVENIDLSTEYNNIPLTLHYVCPPLSSSKNTLGVFGGVQVGFLDAISVRVNNNDATISETHLAKTDFGLVAGGEYNIYFGKHLILSPGIIATYTQDAAKLFLPNTTEQFGIGVKLGLTYRFKNHYKDADLQTNH